jgi:hypothetical protein
MDTKAKTELGSLEKKIVSDAYHDITSKLHGLSMQLHELLEKHNLSYSTTLYPYFETKPAKGSVTYLRIQLNPDILKDKLFTDKVCQNFINKMKHEETKK